MIEPGLELLTTEQRCPVCGKGRFLRGPSGGLSTNIECAACGQRYNVGVWQGRICQAECIPYNGIWPDRGDWELRHEPPSTASGPS